MSELSNEELEELDGMEIDGGPEKAAAKTAKSVAASDSDVLDAKQLMADVAINEANLSGSMTEQMGLYVHYASIYAEAQRVEAREKLRVQATEAKIDREIRAAATEEGRKVTEASIAKEIQSDSRYVKAQNAYNNAKADASFAKEALEAFKQRRDMLIQMGVMAREERQGEMRMNGQGADEERKQAAVRMAEGVARASNE